jgi:hypothetical protein
MLTTFLLLLLLLLLLLNRLLHARECNSLAVEGEKPKKFP